MIICLDNLFFVSLRSNSGDIVSSYIWRGQDLGSTSLQPTLGLGFRGLSLSAWGSVGLADPADTKELDLTLGYTIGGLNVGFGIASLQWFTNFAGGATESIRTISAPIAVIWK